MEKVDWKVEGMTCANCALTIHKYLEKEGLNDIKVSALDGHVSFQVADASRKPSLKKGIDSLGYSVVDETMPAAKKPKKIFSSHLHRFLFCLPFTLVLMLHMFPSLGVEWIMNPWLQLALAIPVYIVGMSFFGRSAIKSIANGVPNMNVLIALGATAAFVYSLAGHLMGLGHDYLFYETSATIITLVFMGNYLEDVSMSSTQKALRALVSSQKIMANMIAFDDQHKEQIFPVENSQLRVGDLILIRSGEQVPIDCSILWGDAEVNESIITGESVPVNKKKKDRLIGGSTLVSGSVKAQVTATGADTVLAGILKMVKQAQGEKPPMQKLADRISAIFVPVVILIAIGTITVNWIILGDFQPSLMRGIAVLVIACPCAMGLATPAAIAVGLGRGARNGILFRNAESLELFRNIRQIVFDKTGTLTTGNFSISKWEAAEHLTDEAFKNIAFSLEKYSAHPLAKTISREWRSKDEIRWRNIEEVKGLGMKAEDRDGNSYMATSFAAVKHLTNEKDHSVYIVKNNELAGWINLEDEIRPEAETVIRYLQAKGVHTILLSGDSEEKCTKLADRLGISEVIAEQTPGQKLQKITELTSQQPTIMVGDGINDAPALAKATIGISMSEASQLAMQSAQVVLMNHGLAKLPSALGLGKHTYNTIKQNLFWTFSYNIIAIPVAALGLLTPSFAALVMGFSDLVLAGNSLRLFTKKLT